MTCPNCGKDTVERYRPFCSKRCADVDLGRWLNESYTIPDKTPPTSPEGEATPSTEPPHGGI